MVKHLHILKPFEGIGQDIPLGLGVGVAAFGIETIGLLHCQPGCPASLVELPEVGCNIAEFHPALVIGI